MKSREKLSLVVFLLVVFCLAHAINSPSSAAPLTVQISELNGNACPTCSTGYDPYFCHANYFRSPATATATKSADGH